MTSSSRPIEVHLGDVLRLRKEHACQGNEWEVVRLGADIGLLCQKCNHRILMPRPQLERRLKSFISRAPLPAFGGTEPEPAPLAPEATDPEADSSED